MSKIVVDNVENIAGTSSATVEDVVNGAAVRADLAAMTPEERTPMHR